MEVRVQENRAFTEPEARMIPIQEFNAALMDLNFQTAQWYRAQFGETCQICMESPASRLLILTMLEHLVRTMRTGGDFSTPLVLLAGTMLQTGYMIGRRHAEAEVLEGWMRL
jgi:hypothetical protein